MRRQLPSVRTSNISTSRNDVLFHVTGVLPAIEILKTGAIKCSKPSAWERAEVRLRACGQELPDNPNYSRVAAAMRW